MPYKRGRPLADTSIYFRLASMMTLRLVELIAYPVYFILFRTTIKGRYKLEKIKNAILVSNHTTFLDPVLISAVVWPHVTYHTLLEQTVVVPVLGTYTRLLGGIPVKRGMKSLLELPSECKRAFKHRRTIHFYPEGECFLNNQTVKPFNNGAFLVSAELDVPVYPLATVFTERKNSTKPKITLYIMDPIYPKDFNCIDSETGKADLKAVKVFAEHVRNLIQNEINIRGGTNKFYKGQLERIAGLND